MKPFALALLLAASAWLPASGEDSPDTGLDDATPTSVAVARWKFPKPPGGGNAYA